MRTFPGKIWMRSEVFKARVNHSVVEKEEDHLRFKDMDVLDGLKD